MIWTVSTWSIPLFRILKIIPWPIRLVLLLVIAVPLFKIRLITDLVDDDPIHRLEIKTVYACFVWSFIVANVGLDKFYSYIQAAFIAVVSTVVIGAAIMYMLHLVGQTNADKMAMSESTVGILFMLTISLPYFFFMAQCFSPARFFERIDQSAGSSSVFWLHVAVWLRVFQHLGEVFPALIVVWREEHPGLYLPRFRDDWHSLGLLKRSVNIAEWFASSFFVWAKCMMVFGVSIVPTVNNEAVRLVQNPGEGVR
jgi:hypothetical protein